MVDLNVNAPIALMGISQGAAQFYVASVAKLAIMVAAFSLRERLKAFGLSLSTTRADDLIARFDSVYRRPISTRFKAAPDFPALSKIFLIRDRASNLDPWVIEFLQTNQRPPNDVNPGTKISPNVGFADCLALTIGVSNNDAASRCIRDLGFQYIHGEMEDIGFYKRDTGGLWLGKAYDKTPPWLFPPKGGIQSANAQSLAILLTAIDRGRLVNSDASVGMRALMARSGSFIADALKNGHSQSSVLFAKDGLDAGITSEVAVCQKQNGVRYGSVIIGMQNQAAFDAAALAIDALF